MTRITLVCFVENKRLNHLMQKMRMQYYISIQRCPLGFWYALPESMVMRKISDDQFNGHVEKLYPGKRPCIYY
jgi:hypothetical protein